MTAADKHETAAAKDKTVEAETLDETMISERPATGTDLALAWQLEEPAELDWGGHSRRAWFISIGALLAALAALGATVFALWWGKGSEAGPTAKVGPPTRLAPPGPVLDGTYELDSDGAHRTINGVQTSGEDITRWWAFRSVCTTAGCVATSAEVSDSNHQVASDDHDHSVLRWRNGAWREDPDRTYDTCNGNSDSPRTVITLVRSLAPQVDGTLKGTETDTAEDNGCGAQTKGEVIQFPILAKRVGDVPPGVVADPATAVPPEPTAAPPAAAPSSVESSAAIQAPTTPMPATATPSAAAFGTPAQDAEFLRMLQNHGITMRSGVGATNAGHTVCGLISTGQPPDQITPHVVEQNPGISFSSAQFFVNAAITVFCPQYG